MISKQLWRRSTYHLLISLILLITPTLLIAMEQFNYASLKEENSFREVKQPTNFQQLLPERPPLITEDQKKTRRFYGHTWKQIMEAYEAAPWEVQHIVKHLNYPDKFQDDDYRAAFFVGPSGSGKTASAIAIPHIVNWYCKFIASTELEGSIRNQTSRQLLQTLYNIANSKRKIVVIIDELEELFEHYESENYDTASTARSFWTFLDRQAGNRNFFLIGTMNRNNMIPFPLKTRMDSDCIYFSPITNPVRKRSIFIDELQSTNMMLDKKECTNQVVDEHIASLGDATPRLYKNIRKKISRLLWKYDPVNNSRVIKKKHIDEAIEMMKYSHEQQDMNRKEESEEQRQERHHQENLQKQDQFFVQNHMYELDKELFTKTVYEYYEDDSIKSTRQESIDSEKADIMSVVLSSFTKEQILEYCKLHGRRKEQFPTFRKQYNETKKKIMEEDGKSSSNKK